MILLIDAGNTRLKWELREQGRMVDRGAALMSELDTDSCFSGSLPAVSGVAVSTVVSEARRHKLADALEKRTGHTPRFYWSESSRRGWSMPIRIRPVWGLTGGTGCMGHGSGAVQLCGRRCGSAVTVDFVAADGTHLGGYILPGRGMMLRSLKSDAARIGFEPDAVDAAEPGTDTGECVLHGQVWLKEALEARLQADMARYGLGTLFLTGGDANLFGFSGVTVDRSPSLVLDGLEAIVREEAAR